MKQQGRHCRLCGMPGGTPATLALRALGLQVERSSAEQRPDLHAYAHPNCIAKAKRKSTRQPLPGNSRGRKRLR